MKRFLISLYLIVITDPYSSINYSEIKSYSYNENYRTIEMTIYNHDGVVVENIHDEETEEQDYSEANYNFVPWFFQQRQNGF